MTTSAPDIVVTVLGSSGGYPAYGLPCSGYLVEAAGQRLLLDCGSGVTGALLAESDRCGLDAIIISHMHPDHILDLMPLGYALLTEWISGGRTTPLPLYLPTGGKEFLQRFSDLFGHRHWRMSDAKSDGHRAIAAALERGEDWFTTVFDMREYEPGEGWNEGAFTIATMRVDHSVPTAAMRIGTGGRELVYSGDTRFMPALADFASDAELFLVDAHLSGPKAPGGAHMTPADAGILAQKAGVCTLVLCHLGGPEDADSALSAAAQSFKGNIHVALRDKVYTI